MTHPPAQSPEPQSPPALAPRRLLTRRNFFRVAGAALCGAAGVGLYTWRVEPHWVEIVRRPLPIANLPASLVGATLAQLSDLHIGPRVDDDYLLGVFERVSRLQPEIVVYTGDFTSHHEDIVAHARRVFPYLPQGRRGTFGILGNHDYGINWRDRALADQLTEVAEAAGVRMLRNATGNADGLKIVGLDDVWARQFKPEAVMGALDGEEPALVLSHNPDTADRDVWGDYAGWILAGHTHGGQCKPPFLPPPLLPVMNRRYTSGAFALTGGRRMYINRGVGHLIRVRINARPEVTLFELVRA